jgi:hypothetical protein
MKIRSGFVSNSSSSSFILDGTKYNEDKIRKIIFHMLEALHIADPNESYTVDEICEIHERASGLEFLRQIESFYESIGQDAYDDELKFMSRAPFDKPCVIVDSTNDNSIPWPIQEFLEDIAIKRQHWG